MRTIRSFCYLTFIIALCCLAPTGQSAPLTAQQKVLHALNRMAFGPRPGDVEKVQKMGLSNWIDAQLNPATIDDSAVDQKLAAMKMMQLPMSDLVFAHAADRSNVESKLRNDANGKVPLAEKERNRLLGIQQQMQQRNIREGTSYMALGELINSRFLRAVESDRQLQEVLVDFWSNHFNLDAKKGMVTVLVIGDERDVIRPHVLGKFRDLLGASAKSPAMLEYLDNASSRRNPDQPGMMGGRNRRGPDKNRPGDKRRGFQKTSFQLVADAAPMMPANPTMPDFVKNPPQQGAKGKGGLNENYGRELMELHTLGVDGGYTQEDVINVARCFTGWTLNRQTGEFAFRPALHDNGTKVVLGQVIPPDGGIADGEKVLDILAASPATARHLSYQLCQRLVSDEPPPALVDKVAGVWQKTDGDLRAVVRAIVTSPEFNSTSVYRTKIKSPYEYVVSSVRALGGNVTFPDNPRAYRKLMIGDGVNAARPNNRLGRNGFTTLSEQTTIIGQAIYSYQPPTGYPENSQGWVSTGALVARLNYALALANGTLENVVASPSSLLVNVSEEDKEGILNRLTDGILHVAVSPATKNTLLRESATGILVDRRKLTALIIGSPEFQRR